MNKIELENNLIFRTDLMKCNLNGVIKFYNLINNEMLKLKNEFFYTNKIVYINNNYYLQLENDFHKITVFDIYNLLTLNDLTDFLEMDLPIFIDKLNKKLFDFICNDKELNQVLNIYETYLF